MTEETNLPTPKRNYRIYEFVRIYGIGRTKAYEEIRVGRLKCFKVGKITLISKESAEAWQCAYQNSDK